jgi:hypothetical protein
MRKQYLRLSAYSCDRCNGPVVSGSLAFRDNEIAKETDIRHVGAICLSCGHRQSQDATGEDVAQKFPPVRWEPANPIDLGHISSAFGEMLSRAQ